MWRYFSKLKTDLPARMFCFSWAQLRKVLGDWRWWKLSDWLSGRPKVPPVRNKYPIRKPTCIISESDGWWFFLCPTSSLLVATLCQWKKCVPKKGTSFSKLHSNPSLTQWCAWFCFPWYHYSWLIFIGSWKFSLNLSGCYKSVEQKSWAICWSL